MKRIRVEECERDLKGSWVSDKIYAAVRSLLASVR
jgi:hypothetical protein